MSTRNEHIYLRDTVYANVASTLGSKKRKNHDWFDENDDAITGTTIHYTAVAVHESLCACSCIKALLLTNRRLQWLGFATGCSASNTFLALRLRTEIHREYGHALYVVCVCLEAAFDPQLCCENY